MRRLGQTPPRPSQATKVLVAAGVGAVAGAAASWLLTSDKGQRFLRGVGKAAVATRKDDALRKDVEGAIEVLAAAMRPADSGA